MTIADEEIIGFAAAIAAGVVVVFYAWWTAWRRRHPTISSDPRSGSATLQAHIRP